MAAHRRRLVGFEFCGIDSVVEMTLRSKTPSEQLPRSSRLLRPIPLPMTHGEHREKLSRDSRSSGEEDPAAISSRSRKEQLIKPKQQQPSKQSFGPDENTKSLHKRAFSLSFQEPPNTIKMLRFYLLSLFVASAAAFQASHPAFAPPKVSRYVRVRCLLARS